MKSKKTIYSLGVGLVLNFINIIIGFVVPKILLSYFGSEVNGLISSIKQILIYFKLVEAGLGGATILSLYKPLNNNNWKEINGILTATNNYYLKSGIFFSVGIFVVSVVYPIIIPSEINWQIITSLILILGFNGALEFFTMGRYQVLLTADQREYIISIIEILAVILNSAVIIILSICGVAIQFVLLVATSSYMLRSILLSSYTKKKYCQVSYKETPDPAGLDKRWSVLIHQVSGSVVLGAPIPIITVLFGLKEVSVYMVYALAFNGIGAILGVVRPGIVAGFGIAFVENSEERIKELYGVFEFGYYAIITWAYACVAVLITSFIKLFTAGITDADYSRPLLAILMIIMGIANCVRIPQHTLVSAAGHYQETKWRAIIETPLNIVASIIFGVIWGLDGVLMGQIISLVYRMIYFINYNSKHITHFPLRITILRIFRMLLLGTIIVIPFMILHINVNSYITWFFSAICIAIWAGTVVLVGNYFLEKQTFNMLLNQIKNTIMRKI